MKPIKIDFIEQDQHRYSTLGDYGETDSEIWFKITRFDNPMYSIAILLHEIYEKYRKDQQGVTDEAVDAFDMGPGAELDDPGWSLDAPYHSQHAEADVIERACIALSSNDWAVYENAIEEILKCENNTQT